AHREIERPFVALAVALGVSALLAWSGRAFLRRRLQTVASVLASYREGDFSIRARTAVGPDAPLFDVLSELNELGETLRQHRLGEMEAWALLRKVLAEIDVVVVAVDDAGTVRLANEAASRAFGKSVSALVGVKCTDLGIDDLVAGEAPRIVKSAVLGT